MPESKNPSSVHAELPSGFLHAEQLQETLTVDSSVLPWLTEPLELHVARCVIEGGKEFLLASAISSHRRLVAAAEGMTDSQKQITDNMFYSRIASFIEGGYARTVEAMPEPSTPFPINVMRNKGGQRVYFGVPTLSIAGQEPQPVVMRLAVCDKNKQGEVMKVLSGASKLARRRGISK